MQQQDSDRTIATAWFLAGLGAVPFVVMALASALRRGLRRLIWAARPLSSDMVQ